MYFIIRVLYADPVNTRRKVLYGRLDDLVGGYSVSRLPHDLSQVIDNRTAEPSC